MTLIERLLRLSAMWADANQRSLPRLATIVANDGKLFERLQAGKSCTVATLERFVAHLSAPVNWPGEAVPEEAERLMLGLRANDLTGSIGEVDTADRCASESGNADEISTYPDQAFRSATPPPAAGIEGGAAGADSRAPEGAA